MFIKDSDVPRLRKSLSHFTMGTKIIFELIFWSIWHRILCTKRDFKVKHETLKSYFLEIFDPNWKKLKYATYNTEPKLNYRIIEL